MTKLLGQALAPGALWLELGAGLVHDGAVGNQRGAGMFAGTAAKAMIQVAEQFGLWLQASLVEKADELQSPAG